MGRRPRECPPPPGLSYLDVVVLGASHHQVVLAGGLGDRQPHHGADVAGQLGHGLEPVLGEARAGAGGQGPWAGGRGRSAPARTAWPESWPPHSESSSPGARGTRDGDAATALPAGRSPERGPAHPRPRPHPRPPRLPPAELPDADGVARGGVQHGARRAQGDLVDLLLALRAGEGAGGRGGAGVTRGHLARGPARAGEAQVRDQSGPCAQAGNPGTAPASRPAARAPRKPSLTYRGGARGPGPLPG